MNCTRSTVGTLKQQITNFVLRPTYDENIGFNLRLWQEDSVQWMCGSYWPSKVACSALSCPDDLWSRGGERVTPRTWCLSCRYSGRKMLAPGADMK